MISFLFDRTSRHTQHLDVRVLLLLSNPTSICAFTDLESIKKERVREIRRIVERHACQHNCKQSGQNSSL